MKDYKLFASLSYFSIFFAAFIFPIAVYLIVQDEEVKNHAKKALISHVIPLITVIFIIFSILSGSIPSIVGSLIFFIILDIGIIVWNVVQGIKVLL